MNGKYMFYDMIADMISIIPSIIRGRKPIISLVLIIQSCTKGRNTSDFFIMKTPNKRKLQPIVANHSSKNEFDEFKKFYCRAIFIF